ncbi:MAG: phosphoribosylanthranilate isomerase [Cyanobacteriota bacterium]|nr:phosphoribosylanthranilate isomerase [Cyanobacteriota bacterium]
MTHSAAVAPLARSRRPWVKICGLRDPGQAAAIAAMGVDAIGVVAVPGSPRFVPLESRSLVFQAAREARSEVLGVLVTADPADGDVSSLGTGHGHDVVQLHGGESVERCRQLRRQLGAGVALWKALRIRGTDDLRLCQAYGEVVDAVLLDAWVPHQLGGTGHAIPLDWLQDFTPSLPWWLAGGLTPENVGEALKRSRPDGVDLSSGVEERPGWKDLERVEQLVEAVAASRI